MAEDKKKAKESGIYVNEDGSKTIRVRGGDLIPAGFTLRNEGQDLSKATSHNEEGAPIEAEPAADEFEEKELELEVEVEEESEEESEEDSGEAKPKPKRNR